MYYGLTVVTLKNNIQLGMSRAIILEVWSISKITKHTALYVDQ